MNWLNDYALTLQLHGCELEPWLEFGFLGCSRLL